MPLPLLALTAAAGFAWKIWKSGAPRKVFFSFHYADIWKVQQVRNCWVTRDGPRAAGCFD